MIKESLDPYAQMIKQVKWYDEIVAKDNGKENTAAGIVTLNYERVLQQNSAINAQCKMHEKGGFLVD